jgi:hypothetical protein
MHFKHHREALGIDESQPRISWRFGGSVVVSWQQSAYELEVSNGHETQLRSFQACFNESCLVKWPSSLLTSGQRAQVRVRVHGQVSRRNGCYKRAKGAYQFQGSGRLASSRQIVRGRLWSSFFFMLSTSLAGLSLKSSSLGDICMKRQGDVSNKQLLISG